MNMDMARADTFNLMASLTEVVIFSFERSFPIILAPPETLNTTGIGKLASTEVLNTPLVSISESA